MDMQQGQAAWACSRKNAAEIQHKHANGHAALICSLDMQLGHGAHRHAAFTRTMERQHRHVTWTGGMDMQHVHAAWTSSISIQDMEMQHGDVDMQHCINMNMQQGH
jgi:hypothetical protein